MVMNLYFAICATFLLLGVVNPSQHGSKSKKRRHGMRVVGGNESSIDVMPYIVSFHDAYGYSCGGSILSPCYVLTSAGCVYGKEMETLTIRAGSSYINESGSVYGVSNVIIHPKFYQVDVDYDVALVKTSSPIILGTAVKTIHLAEEQAKLGDMVTVAGWGEQSEGAEFEFLLRSTEIKVVDHQKCAQLYESFFPVTDRMFCAYRPDKGTCHGDNGGPVVYKKKLVGVISHRLGCAMKGVPEVHTDTAHPDIREFITSQLQEGCVY